MDSQLLMFAVTVANDVTTARVHHFRRALEDQRPRSSPGRQAGVRETSSANSQELAPETTYRRLRLIRRRSRRYRPLLNGETRVVLHRLGGRQKVTGREESHVMEDLPRFPGGQTAEQPADGPVAPRASTLPAALATRARQWRRHCQCGHNSAARHDRASTARISVGQA